MQCKNCHERINSDAGFCPFCGYDVKIRKNPVFYIVAAINILISAFIILDLLYAFDFDIAHNGEQLFNFFRSINDVVGGLAAPFWLYEIVDVSYPYPEFWLQFYFLLPVVTLCCYVAVSIIALIMKNYSKKAKIFLLICVSILILLNILFVCFHVISLFRDVLYVVSTAELVCSILALIYNTSCFIFLLCFKPTR